MTRSIVSKRRRRRLRGKLRGLFGPRPDLLPAHITPILKRGSRGSRKLKAAIARISDEPIEGDVELSNDPRQTNSRTDRLAAARELVVNDREILGGVPVVRGTRIPVHEVAGSVTAGIPTKRILAAYPSLDADKVELAALYAEGNPPPGPTMTRDNELPEGAVIVADKRVPRDRRAE